MPLYKYECLSCLKQEDRVLPMKERNTKKICKYCGMHCKRIFEAPHIQIGKPANTDTDRDDAFWDNAERLRLKQEKKRLGDEREKLRFGDKKTMRNEEAKIKNYEQTGNQESADNVIKKLEAVKK